MDGNGRWATRRGLSRLRGHEAGVEAIRRVVEAAPGQGVGTLTLYAFSSDNWRRPKAEVSGLMALLRSYLADEIDNLARNGVRLTVIGRRDRLPEWHCTSDRPRGSGDRRRRCAASSHRDRLFGPRRHPECRGQGRSRSRPGPISPAKRSLNSSPAKPACATSISSSAPAARSGCRTSCSGKAPMPNCTSPSGCGRNSTRTISPRRWQLSSPRAPVWRPAVDRARRCPEPVTPPNSAGCAACISAAASHAVGQPACGPSDRQARRVTANDQACG